MIACSAAASRAARLLVASALLGTVLQGAASAQIIDQSTAVVPPRAIPPSTAPSAFRRDRDVPVRERQFPAFTAQGVRLGDFDLFPSLMIAPEFISNIYANNDDRHADLAVLVRPEFTLRNSSGQVNVDLYGTGTITRLASHTSENTEEGTGGLRIAAPVGSLSSITGGVSYGQRVLARYASDSPVDAAEPLRYRELDANLGGSAESGRVRLTGRVDLAQLSFDDGETRAGQTLVARDRNRTFVTGLARAEYAVKPDLSVYLAATGNRIDYKLPLQGSGLDRDSRGYGVFAGASFDLTDLIRGDARIGYIHQQFDARGVRAISGLGLLGTLYYFPTRLLTVTLRGTREVRDTGVPGTLGNVHTGADLLFDQELRRYLILSASAGYSTDNYRGTVRTDRNGYAALSATYLSRRHWNAKLGYQYNRRHCDCTFSGAQFDDHRLLAGLTFQY